MDRVNERSTWFTDISFTDENGEPVVPTAAKFRIDDVQSGEAVRDDTDIDELDTSIKIIWEPSDTRILDKSRAYETRRLTVSWEYISASSPPTDAEGHAEFLLQVRNLAGVVSPSPA